MTAKLDLKNKIMNGCFDFWQRGISFPAASGYTADRFIKSGSGSAAATVTRSADVPTNAFGTYSMLTTVTTAQASLGANDGTWIYQLIEGNVLRTFKNKKMVLTFWVKSSKAGIYTFWTKNAHAATRCLTKEFTINSANTWEKKTLRFQQDSTGTWAYDNSIGTIIGWGLASGTTFRSPSNDSWLSGNYIAGPNQTNWSDTVGATFALADVCLVEDNEGQTRDPDFMYAGRDYFEELQLCQRYFEKSWAVNTPVGTANGGVLTFVLARPIGAGGFIDDTHVFFKVPKRANPTATLYHPNGTAGQMDVVGTARTATIGADTLRLSVSQNTSGVLWADQSYYQFQWTADAEL